MSNTQTTVTNAETFLMTYYHHLRDCVRNYPEEYGYPLSEVPSVLNRMRDALRRGSYNKDSRAFRMTCTSLGIAHTYKDINAYINS